MNDLYIKESEIQGNGLFTNTHIPKNTIIWKEHDKCQYYTLDELKMINSKYIAEHCFYSHHKNVFIYPNDLTIYINHSENPNCLTVDGQTNVTITLRDIYQGEELLEDYSTFDNNEPTKLICKYYDFYSPVL